mmetsp:Transcript_27419/g.59938  ORF Transcript_27419/g.59938 Transcript_27419/m.59938 type:complete len:317 (+) Transcript_27419:652-1602(+)
MRALDLLNWNKGLHNQGLELQSLPEVADHGEHIFTLALVKLLDVHDLLLCFLILIPELLKLGGHLLHLLLLRCALGLQLQVLQSLLLLPLLKLLLDLLLPAKLLLLALQLLLLLNGLLHDLLPRKHLMLHSSKLAFEFSLPRLFSHGVLLLPIDLCEEPLLLALGQLSLCCDVCSLRVRLPSQLLVAGSQIGLHLRDLLRPSTLLDDHLLLHRLLYDLLNVHHLLLDAWWKRSWSSMHRSLAAFESTSSAIKLRLQPHDLILELADHGILRVLVDARLVLDALRSIRVPERGESFVVIVVSRTTICHHHGLGVAAQ